MRDRNLVPAALAGAIVCCGATALIAGLAGGVALAAIGRFTVVSVVGLGVVAAIAWRLDHRRRGDRFGCGDRAAQLDRTRR
ncbi:MAG: hypothetical protein KDB35_18530 [Acidimicrobiales bacterium]|nr:hypothetical protein [Acidimicrobiales bacterium]MCB9373475.1 hypothetical protein [Microthrixaceae bacterium]